MLQALDSDWREHYFRGVRRATTLTFLLAVQLAWTTPVDAQARDSVKSLRLLRLAFPALDAERYADAVPLLEQAVRADTLSAIATALLGVAYIKVNRHDDARKVLVRSIALDSTSALAHGLLASTLHEHSYEHEAAYGHARRALQLDPTDLSWRTNYVESCFATKRFEEARDSALSVATDTAPKAGEYRPLMYFFATASRLLQNRRADAKLDLQRFVDAYGAAPLGVRKEWEFQGTKHFVMEVAGASEENKIAILTMIRVLEQSKTASSIDDLFKSLPGDLVTGLRRPSR